MNREKVIKLKERAMDRMLLCYSVFEGNKPPTMAHGQELIAHAAFYQSLCLELGPPIGQPSTLAGEYHVRLALGCLEELVVNDDDHPVGVRLAMVHLQKALRAGEGSS